MYTLSDKSQFQAHAVKAGKHKLAIAEQEIMDWITKEFGVQAVDFFCETRATSKGAQQQVVHLILDTPEEVKKIQGNRAATTAIAERFIKYFKLTEPDNVFTKIIVTYRPLMYPDSKAINEMLTEEKSAIFKTFESVWTMSQSVIFYYTDAQIKENQANGISKRLGEELDKVFEKYGSVRSSDYRFDSKESFDRDYESKWHYYWK